MNETELYGDRMAYYEAEVFTKTKVMCIMNACEVEKKIDTTHTQEK